MGKSGSSFPLLLGDTNDPSERSPIPDSDGRALRHLVSCAVPQEELPSVIETVLSNVKAIDVVRRLQGSDAQPFIDMIDEVCHHAILSRRISSLTPVSTF